MRNQQKHAAMLAITMLLMWTCMTDRSLYLFHFLNLILSLNNTLSNYETDNHFIIRVKYVCIGFL